MWPSSHSSGSRTSTKSEPSDDSRRSLRLDGRDLVDLGLDLCQQLAVRRHYFRNYSFGVLAIVRRCPRSVVSRSSSLPSPSRRSRPSPAAILSSDGDSAGTAASTTSPGLRAGRPPLSFALGFRTDAGGASDLRGAGALRARRPRGGERALRRARLARGEGRARRSPSGRTARSTGSSSSRSSIPRSRSCSSTSGSRGCGRTTAIPSRPGARRSTPSRTRRTRSSPGTCCTRISRAACPRSSLRSPRPPRSPSLPPARQLEALRSAARHGGCT